MKVILLTHKPDLTLALRAVKCCVSTEPVNDLSLTGTESALETALKAGHHSVIEHIQLTFAIEGISRVCSHQLVRHRLASFSQKSDRYAEGLTSFTRPDTISDNREFMHKYREHMDKAYDFYMELVNSGIPKEDARYVLPQAMNTQMIISMNCRELLHFFNLRLCNKSQWEINRLAWQMFKECYQVLPEIFKHAATDCIDGQCKQPKPCGDSLSVSCMFNNIKQGEIND